MKKAGIVLLELFFGIIILYFIINQSKSIKMSAITDDKFISVEKVDKVFEMDEVNKNEFFEMSNDADIECVYIYMVSPKSYQRFIVECDTASNEIIELPVGESVRTIYYSFPEMTTVRAGTFCHCPGVSETAYYEILTLNREGVVGGSPVRRIYSQELNASTTKDLEFTIYNAFEADEVNADSAIFGKYFFKLIY